MKKLMMIGAVGLLLGGCAVSPPPSMVDPNNPDKLILTPEQRNKMAATTLALNPGVTFTEASISQPQSVGSAIGDKWPQYRVCVRWRGTGADNGDPSKYHYVGTVFRNGELIRPGNRPWDSCAIFATPTYQPLPELMALQDKVRKARASVVGTKR